MFLNIELFEELQTFTSKSFNDIIEKIKTNNYKIKEIIEYRSKYIEIDTNNAINDLTDFILRLI